MAAYLDETARRHLPLRREHELYIATKSPTLGEILALEAQESRGPERGGDLGHTAGTLEVFNADGDWQPGTGEGTDPKAASLSWDVRIQRIESDIAAGQDLNQAWASPHDGECDTTPWLNVIEGARHGNHIGALRLPAARAPEWKLEQPPARPIKSAAKAKLHPDWSKPNGLREACEMEFKRVFEQVFPGQSQPTMILVPISHMRAAELKYGKSKVTSRNPWCQ